MTDTKKTEAYPGQSTVSGPISRHDTVIRTSEGRVVLRDGKTKAEFENQ